MALVLAAKVLTCAAMAWILAAVVVELADAHVTAWLVRRRARRQKP